MKTRILVWARENPWRVAGMVAVWAFLTGLGVMGWSFATAAVGSSLTGSAVGLMLSARRDGHPEMERVLTITVGASVVLLVALAVAQSGSH